MKIAILSNINVNPIIRQLKKFYSIYETEGYGNEIGLLINANASIWTYKPDLIFIIEDLMELLNHEIDEAKAEESISDWFLRLEQTIEESVIYYISDVFLWGKELEVIVDKTCKRQMEDIWMNHLSALVGRYTNVRIFPFSKLVDEIGVENAFSTKMWYMGKILYSNVLQKSICDEIRHIVNVETRINKKMLLLDLDNTLWGGLAGEHDISPIELSDDHIGLAYKNLQRVILQMKKQGVLLGIVSKNNEDDALDIIRNCSHMVLKENDFAIKKINWQAKDINIREIARELNIGLDTMVFLDDNPAERLLVQESIPEVTVIDFPDNVEDLPSVMVDVWHKYFEQAVMTIEDKEKTDQYLANARRNELRNQAIDFETYLDSLEIELIRKNEKDCLDRIVQLLNKTNQFNLTTQRHDRIDIQQAINDSQKQIFAYQVKDKFGDNGIVAAVIVDMLKDKAVISEFVMSCRVMGRNIEYAIIDDIEDEMKKLGYAKMESLYIQTKKNKPVSDLYGKMDYEVIAQTDEEKRYQLDLAKKTNRNYRLAKKSER